MDTRRRQEGFTDRVLEGQSSHPALLCELRMSPGLLSRLRAGWLSVFCSLLADWYCLETRMELTLPSGGNYRYWPVCFISVSLKGVRLPLVFKVLRQKCHRWAFGVRRDRRM